MFRPLLALVLIIPAAAVAADRPSWLVERDDVIQVALADSTTCYVASPHVSIEWIFAPVVSCEGTIAFRTEGLDVAVGGLDGFQVACILDVNGDVWCYHAGPYRPPWMARLAAFDAAESITDIAITPDARRVCAATLDQVACFDPDLRWDVPTLGTDLFVSRLHAGRDVVCLDKVGEKRCHAEQEFLVFELLDLRDPAADVGLAVDRHGQVCGISDSHEACSLTWTNYTPRTGRMGVAVAHMPDVAYGNGVYCLVDRYHIANCEWEKEAFPVPPGTKQLQMFTLFNRPGHACALTATGSLRCFELPFRHLA